MQALAMNPLKIVPFYVIGLLGLFGLVLGRLICGFLCPFGFIQELLYRISSPKPRIRYTTHRHLIKLKYVVLIVFVLGIPMLLATTGGIGFPAFCQWICPAGTLEAGIPLVIANSKMRSAVGFLFSWKCAVSLMVVVASVLIYRPFCKYLCPLGAVYSLFNRVSIVTINTDSNKCVGCGKCYATCKMQAVSALDPECIRCGECVRNCPHSALKWEIGKQRHVVRQAMAKE
jgi:polyferredoxin